MPYLSLHKTIYFRSSFPSRLVTLDTVGSIKHYRITGAATGFQPGGGKIFKNGKLELGRLYSIFKASFTIVCLCVCQIEECVLYCCLNYRNMNIFLGLL